MKVFLPFRGELGHHCMWHAPQVHAEPWPKIVCCEPGLEALYPDACYHFVCHRRDEDRREHIEAEFVDRTMAEFVNAGADDLEFVAPDQDAPRAYFQPAPLVPCGITADIVVCPRKRKYGDDKNWPHWGAMADRLGERWVVGAAGNHASRDVHADHKAWERPRPLDASIELMRSARLVVATDSGLAHLAMLCGTPVIMVSYGPDCLVAPGGPPDSTKRPEYWPIKVDRFMLENHMQVPLEVVPDSWGDIDLLIEHIERFMDGTEV